ncbi:MAG: GIY-YIG nuclease family protein [Patescibacteria group bacterium]|nr:GIY-YIG nuclease family protein [Patescibacteria group bacterium]
MSYFVYILYSLKDKKLYVGCTSDIKERLDRHNDGYVNATKYRRPLELIHTEQYANKAEAFNRERFLKSLWGARIKKKILQEYINKVGRNS